MDDTAAEIDPVARSVSASLGKLRREPVQLGLPPKDPPRGQGPRRRDSPSGLLTLAASAFGFISESGEVGLQCHHVGVVSHDTAV